VRSPYAHAKIKSISEDAARAMPGVHDVITGAELRGMMANFYAVDPAGDTTRDVYDEGDDEDAIPVPKVAPLAVNKVRYVGDPVAAVVADTKAQAEDAVPYVEVEYEPLEA